MSQQLIAKRMDWRQMELVENPHRLRLTSEQLAEAMDQISFTIEGTTIGAAQIIGEPIVASADGIAFIDVSIGADS